MIRRGAAMANSAIRCSTSRPFNWIPPLTYLR